MDECNILWNGQSKSLQTPGNWKRRINIAQGETTNIHFVYAMWIQTYYPSSYHGKEVILDVRGCLAHTWAVLTFLCKDSTPNTAVATGVTITWMSEDPCLCGSVQLPFSRILSVFCRRQTGEINANILDITTPTSPRLSRGLFALVANVFNLFFW